MAAQSRARAQARRTDGKTQRADRYLGGIWLTQRDIDGLVLCGEHYAAPYDLLSSALGIGSQANMYRLMTRWRDTGYAATGQLGHGPSWCWLTREGMAATGLGFPATRPALTRLAHIRAVLAARLWLEARPAWTQGQAWWHSERRLKAAQLPPGRSGPREHVPDAEIHWPSLDGSPHAGQVWAIEVELTPKPLARTSRIMTELLTPPRYARVVYLTAPAAGPVVTRAVATLPPDERARITAQNLPRFALTEPPNSLPSPGP
jgi:hypothetical protein